MEDLSNFENGKQEEYSNSIPQQDVIQTLFNLSIYSRILIDNEFTLIKDEVVNYCNKNQKEFSNNKENSLFSNNSLPRDEFAFLKDEIKSASEKYFDSWEFDFSQLFLEEIWIDVIPPNSSVVPHRNTSKYDKNIFSGVLVIENPDGKDIIELVNPSYFMFPSTPTSSKHICNKLVNSQEGSLIIFPSGMGYNIKENSSNNYKIIVNFNIIADNKDTTYE